MKDVESPRDDLRIRGFKDGAACFARGEGMWYSKGSIFIACTNGGKKQRGQIWKLTRNKIELYAEPNDADLVDKCDNLTVSPWGDLILCEDGKGDQFLDVVTPQGKIFKLAKNAKSSGEFAGVFFPRWIYSFCKYAKRGVHLGDYRALEGQTLTDSPSTPSIDLRYPCGRISF